jgi:uncharacterized membrane protein
LQFSEVVYRTIKIYTFFSDILVLTQGRNVIRKGGDFLSTFLVFFSGAIFLGLIIVIKNKAMQGPIWRRVVNWLLYALWFGMTMIGISFIYINSSVGHVKATSTAIFVFLGISVVLAVVLARVLGYFGKIPVKPADKQAA